MQRKTNMNIVVAVHPRSNYKEIENQFNNFDIISGSTISLVQKANFVFGHMSTSMNFAVLYNKPIIFLDSNNYSLRLRSWIKEKAETLDSIIIKIY